MREKSWWQSRKEMLWIFSLGTALTWLAVVTIVLNELTTAQTLAESALQEPGSAVVLSTPMYLTMHLMLLVSVDYVAYRVIRQTSGLAEWLARASYAVPMSVVLFLPDELGMGLYGSLAALIVLFPAMYATEGTWDDWLNERISARRQGA
ncbi:MAG: hypothetical protein RI560_11075 [Natronomonas sp.]|nr:hypothetical protein [Natronomonas sp.]